METPQTRSVEEAPGPPAESAVPRTEINGLYDTGTQKTVDNLEFPRVCLQSETRKGPISFHDID
jgi:hypothetical protein